MKWNILVVLFMMCSAPLFVGCGSDDDEPKTSYSWEDTGNTAKVTYSATAGGYSASAVATFTFNGSGDDAICTKCVIEETFPTDALAQEAEQDYRSDSDMSNVSRSGKKVTYEIDSFIGQTRGTLRQIFGNMHQ